MEAFQSVNRVPTGKLTWVGKGLEGNRPIPAGARIMRQASLPKIPITKFCNGRFTGSSPNFWLYDPGTVYTDPMVL